MIREIGRALAGAATGAMLLALSNVAIAAVSPEKAALATQLPMLAERAVAWAHREESRVLATGLPLTLEQRALARAVGVKYPERIRIELVDAVPLPDEPLLARAASRVGLSQSWAAGLTLGHAVMLRRGFEAETRLLSHEFRHVAQYEEQGGIAAFLAEHLPHLLQKGYEDSPFEVDARAHER